MLSVVTASLSLSAAPFVGHGRQLSQTLIGKYAPNTNVMDHANIDLDQMTLEGAFGTSPYTFAPVKDAWEGAGFSKVTATCTLTAAAAVSVTDGATMTYTGQDGVAKTTKNIGTVTTSSTTLTFKPEVVQDARKARVDTSAAIMISGGSSIGTCSSVTYVGGRTLQGFSTKAKTLMYSNTASTPPGTCPAPKTTVSYKNGCPYTSYTPYFDYYCAKSTSACHANGDYVNQWILSATSTPGTATGLDNFNIDFSTGTAAEETFKKDFIKKTSKFAGAWMYAIREFEDAIDDCVLQDLTTNAWSDSSVHAWDEGVAFYVGSELKPTMFYHPTTGEETTPDSKYLAYTLGNKRCKNFKTCGRTGDMVSGEAYINYELWKAFGDGRDQILSGNCAGAVPVKNHIVNLMSVPLIQGSLRYSFFCRNGVVCTAKAIGELAAFAASILPQVHACNPAAAATIATAASASSYTCTNDQCTGANNDFSAVKEAFESCYPAMGVTCAQVGGLYDANKLAYETGAEPCGQAEDTSGLSTSAIIGIAIGAGAAGLLLLCLVFVLCKERAGTPMFVPMTQGGKPSV